MSYPESYDQRGERGELPRPLAYHIIKNMNPNRQTPHPWEPIALAVITRIMRVNCLALRTPCCKKIAVHLPPFARDMGRYSRRTCAHCEAEYWLHLPDLPKGTMPRDYIRKAKPTAPKRTRR